MYDLEHNTTFEENFHFWIRKFLDDKLFEISSRLLENEIDFNIYSEDILNFDDDFISLKELVRELSSKGLKGLSTYAVPVFKFEEFVTKDKRIKSITQINNNYISSYIKREFKDYSKITVQNHFTFLKIFFSFIEENNIEENNNFEPFLFKIGISRAGKSINPVKNKEVNKAPVFLNVYEFDKFVEGIENFPFKGGINIENKKKFILKTLLYTGLRVNEVLNLRKKSFIDSDEVFKINVVGKGNKHRTVFISKKLIEKELEAVSAIKDEEDLLLTNKNGLKENDRNVYNLVREVLNFSGIYKEKQGPHLLRHSYATYLLSKGVNIVKIKELLGHSDIKTTMIYTHVDTEELEKTSSIFN
jgi:integrase/recombinase XerD